MLTSAGRRPFVGIAAIQSNGKRQSAKAKNQRYEVAQGPPSDLL
jgi:hypothetical protein